MANVLLLISDEHNPLYSSVYGHPFVQTPAMDQLAENGVTFENAYCPSPLCMPCRSAFMSGRRVHQIQAYSNCRIGVDPDIPTYGRVLADQGVHSVHVGKTHVFAPGGELGFREVRRSGADAARGDVEVGRRPFRIRRAAAERATRFGVKESHLQVDLGKVDAAIDWLSNTAPSLGKPWTLAVNINHPHFPHYTSRDLWDLYPQGGDLPEYGVEQETANHPRAREVREHFQTGEFTETQVRGQRRGYLACVTFVDRQLARLIEALKTSGLFDDTNVVYTSDHGEMLGKFGMWWKCSLYEDACRVPCIASGPDFQAGTRVSTPVDLHDVQASLFESTGADRPAHWAGLPLQRIPESDDQRVVFSEYHGHGVRHSAYMIRKGGWKYLHHVDAPHQLFDLDRDPDELQNVYGEFPAVAFDLEGELRSICDPEMENDRADRFIEAQLAAMATNDHPVKNE